MVIDGKAIADSILTRLSGEVNAFKNHGVTPTLAVIQIGDNPASLAYIKQKQKAAERIGATVIVSNTLTDIERLNANPTIHGIIVQRPLPKGTDTYAVHPKKDVDGFEPHSPFDVPVAVAVSEILNSIHFDIISKNMVVIGRGDTAGKPIAEFFQKQHHNVTVIHSQTKNPKEIMKQADVIISCVGKKGVVTADAVKHGAILISVGLWRDEAGKLHGDYEPEDVADIASYYTPTPGGVGPVNVACLMQNLIKACTLKQ